jgi:hypothetical protein
MRTRSFLIIFYFIMLSSRVLSQSNASINIKIDQQSGTYSIHSSLLNWTFEGSVGRSVNNLKYTTGNDSIGKYKAVSFTWNDTINYLGRIKCYEEWPVVLLSYTLPDGAEQSPANFPHFTSVPSSLYHYSFYNDNFAPPQFKLNETSTPWLLFDSNKNACIISPASDFIVSMLSGNGETNISSGLNPQVKQLPPNFTHSTILVLDNGIQNAWNDWGKALRTIYNRKQTANDADTILNYFGYWTDNGADYYYNYDTTKGYANTLLDLSKQYKEEGIPLGYIQLDSWWYDKSITDADGKPDADHKNSKLPYGAWNRYGGLIKYEADSFLFPEGLSVFQKDLGLPLVTHNRWIDPKSPYQTEYKILGYAAVDPKYWTDRMNYLRSSGVVCYEQDWLNYIYNKTPKMSSDINIGNEFTDEMANAAKVSGEDLQYCMAMPRDFMQGVKYNNLTTIRTSEDRLEPDKWMSFIFTSQLAYEMGALPWCDVFMSGEKGNMIIAVLSAGPVGTGDSIGKEDKANIMMACRNDGVLVKPDAPLLPVDNDYVQIARGKNKPILAYTFTKHNDLSTVYLFAFSNTKYGLSFSPSDFGMKDEVVIYNPLTAKLYEKKVNEIFSDVLPEEKYAYYIIAPVTDCGIAFLGDEGKIAATGKKRIADIIATKKNMQVRVLFAHGENQIILHGFCKVPVISDKGKTIYDSASHVFTTILQMPESGNALVVNFSPKF